MFFRLLRVKGKEQATSARRALFSAGPHLGERWGITEVKRLVPTVALFGASVLVIAFWPYGVKKAENVYHHKPKWSP